MTEFKKFLSSLFVFSGRARRREYWVPQLVMTSISYALYALMFYLATLMKFQLIHSANGQASISTNGNLPLTLIFMAGMFASLAFFICRLGLTIRRYHDAGVPGWVYPICLVGVCLCGIGPLVNLVILLLPSKEDNKYGPNPKNDPENEYTDSKSIIITVILAIVLWIVTVGGVLLNAFTCGIDQGFDTDSALNSLVNDINTDETTSSDDDNYVDDEISDDADVSEDLDTNTDDLSNDDSIVTPDNTSDIVTEGNDDDISLTDTNDTANTSTSSGENKTDFYVNGEKITMSFNSDWKMDVNEDQNLITLEQEDDDNYTMLMYTDSWISVGDVASLDFDSTTGEADGELIDKQENVACTDSNGKECYVSMYTYKTTNGNFYIGVVWQDIGVGNYVYETITTSKDVVDPQTILEALEIKL